MRAMKFGLAAIAVTALSACSTVYEQAADTVGTASVLNRAGEQVGVANLYSLAGEVTLSVSFTSLPAGTSAVHLHTTGDCSAGDFTSAGGHLNPGDNQHGTLNPQGAHLGDLPNIEIGSDGSGSMSAILRGRSAEVLPQIFDGDGTALVVHEGPDDYRTDPAGAAGARIACGVFSES
ncbi:superoxide dismutase family protein [Aurantiacibacter gangjinensis]|uniref:Superoxide dismutase copper/zinc binding domain-containing protein n=1 Tax=Aurantiacibacter gangjinensis TaxID=502682 RepID=A0A0G9MND1_9SPHN|nr:superoxide dismutase family protein [Aurantiacibacter gangjinensis]APE27647.1 Superoxide dismutase [Cu-Zn] precursor [Aurantiacibacter gangjinensis]KLE32226.1 hypothetical protein AAW01_09090 [Aurantiacibacter gangjinensis]